MALDLQSREFGPAGTIPRRHPGETRKGKKASPSGIPTRSSRRASADFAEAPATSRGSTACLAQTQASVSNSPFQFDLNVLSDSPGSLCGLRPISDNHVAGSLQVKKPVFREAIDWAPPRQRQKTVALRPLEE